jgi:DNA polymerase (family X)
MEIPAGVLEMLTLLGLRPEKVLRLYKDLGITSLAELEPPQRKDRIKKAKGLGAALHSKILQNLAIAKSGVGRMHLHRAAALLKHATALLRSARPELKRPTIAGDFRRSCELVGDLALVAEAPQSERGPAVLRSSGLKVHLADQKHFGAALLQATGSTAHLNELRALTERNGMRLELTGSTRAAALSAARRKTSTAPLACRSSSLNCASAAARSSGR